MEKMEVKCEHCGGTIKYNISVKLELEDAKPSQRGVFVQNILCKHCNKPNRLQMFLNTQGETRS